MLDSIPDEKRKCHRCNFEKSCRDLVLSGACQRWTKIAGTNPQTGELLDKHGCIDDHIPMLLMEIGRQANSTSVEVNVLRNEVAKSHSESMAMGAVAVQRAGDAVRESFSKTLIDYLPSQKIKMIESAN